MGCYPDFTTAIWPSGSKTKLRPRYDGNVARLLSCSCASIVGRADRSATMTAWQSGGKVRPERGNLAKTLGCQFGHSYDNNLARNTQALGLQRLGFASRAEMRSPEAGSGHSPAKGNHPDHQEHCRPLKSGHASKRHRAPAGMESANGRQT